MYFEKRLIQFESMAPGSLETTLGQFFSFSPKTSNLPFRAPPAMSPQWKVDKYYAISELKSLFNKIEGAKAIDQPFVLSRNFKQCPTCFFLGTDSHSWQKLNRIYMSQWQLVNLGQAPAESGFATTGISDNRNFANLAFGHTASYRACAMSSNFKRAILCFPH